jgi:uncharacterized protein (TIGR03435 family)
VVVRDRDDRFVDTLTRDDFEILEDGQPRPIQQLWVVNLPSDRAADRPTVPAPVLPAPTGVAADVGRIYVLVLGGGDLERVRGLARRFITEYLGPTDLMAVVHVSNRAVTQGLTGDRDLLLASVDRYRGGGGSEASLRMLKDVVVNLTASTGRRKAVLFIGDGFNLWSSAGRTPADVDRSVTALKMTGVFDDLTKTAKRNNVRIYPVSPEGWNGQVGSSDEIASLRILASDTGGISIANTNNYDGNFRRIVRDNNTYYLLTYDSAAEADGRGRAITVRLRNHPNLSLRQGRQSFTAPTPDVKGRAVGLPRNLSPAARSVLTASSQVDGPRIELFTAVFQGTGFDGSILVGTHVPGALLRLAPQDAIEVSYVAIDRWGVVRAAQRRAFALNLSVQNRARAERTGLRLFGRLEVPRGQYQIRVVAYQANGSTASAVATVEVPDYTDQALTVSDFVLASSSGPVLTTLEEDAWLRGALPAQPTPERRFPRGDRLTVFAEIYDSHWILSQEVGVTLTVAREDGRLVFRGEQVLTTANKGRFYMTAKLGLGSFEAGDYQLLVEVNTRKGMPANASRQMRLSVRDAEAPTTDVVVSAEGEVQELNFLSVRRSSVPTASVAGVSGARTGLLVLPDGRFEARGQSLANLARVAFGFEGVDPNRGVVQAADWMWNDRFDITGSVGRPWTTMPTGTTIPDELRTMLRAVLEDRFELKAMIVMKKKVDVTALRPVGSEVPGPDLRQSEAQCRGPFTDALPDEMPPRVRCPYTNEPFRIHAEAVTMPEVAQVISQHPLFLWWGGALVDQTGFPGLFDVSLSIPRGSYSKTGFAAELDKQLGLRLQKTTLPLPTLIIERARRPRED